MVGTLIKQPNGKYCIIDYSDISHYNLTEQDIINMYIENAKAHIGAAEHYGKIISKTVKYTCSQLIHPISNDILKEMGFDKSYDELVKFVPLNPIDKQYAACSFTTYGKCPNCGGNVQDGIGLTEEKCRSCGQLLEW